MTDLKNPERSNLAAHDVAAEKEGRPNDYQRIAS